MWCSLYRLVTENPATPCNISQQFATQHRCVAGTWATCNACFWCCAQRGKNWNPALLFATITATCNRYCTVQHPSSNLQRNFIQASASFFVNPIDRRPRRASCEFSRLSRHKSLQVDQVALHGVCNYNKNIFNVALQIAEKISIPAPLHSQEWSISDFPCSVTRIWLHLIV